MLEGEYSNHAKLFQEPVLTAIDKEYEILIEVSEEFEKQKTEKTAARNLEAQLK